MVMNQICGHKNKGGKMHAGVSGVVAVAALVAGCWLPFERERRGGGKEEVKKSDV